MRDKIIVACDSYKGCMSSKEVNAAVAGSLVKRGVAQCNILVAEMSDGGEGMLDAFLAARHGTRVKVCVHDPLMRCIYAEYAIVGDEAVVEIAKAVGLAHVEPEQRNPMLTTSWGVGEMIMDAYRRGVRRFVVGLGGSATSDCGIGMLRALGDDWKRIAAECSFVIASDVVNPLYGHNGAAHVFAPQKGATPEMVDALDERAIRFAEACSRHFGYDCSQKPGAGAAGGLGYAFLQFFCAKQCSGAELLLQKVGFDELLGSSRLVITGEGHSDRQTLMGKLPMHILSHSKKKGVPVWLVSGGVSDVRLLSGAGFEQVIAVTPKDVALEEAMRKDMARYYIRKCMYNCDL